MRGTGATGVAGTNQRIDGKRLWDSLMSMAEIGATAKGGVRRLTLTDVDRRGRERFRDWCQAAGLTVRVDAIGNMFARRAGRDPKRLPVLVGSHLDSQPSGGKFDGALGVLGGLEVMRTLNDLGIVTEAPIELVNWTDEEGSRFGHSLMGSGVWSGVFGLEETYGLADVDGVRVREALDGIGYRGAEPAEAFPADAYFELHIEQGPILEREEKLIGVVTGLRLKCGTTRWRPGKRAMPGRHRLRRGRMRCYVRPAWWTWWTGLCAHAGRTAVERSDKCTYFPTAAT